MVWLERMCDMLELEVVVDDSPLYHIFRVFLIKFY